MFVLVSVISRLRDLGWGDELDLMQGIDYAPLRGHRHFETPQQLTDDGVPYHLINIT